MIPEMRADHRVQPPYEARDGAKERGEAAARPDVSRKRTEQGGERPSEGEKIGAERE